MTCTMQYAYTTYFVRSEIKINWKCVPSTTTTVTVTVTVTETETDQQSMTDDSQQLWDCDLCLWFVFVVFYT